MKRSLLLLTISILLSLKGMSQSHQWEIIHDFDSSYTIIEEFVNVFGQNNAVVKKYSIAGGSDYARTMDGFTSFEDMGYPNNDPQWLIEKVHFFDIDNGVCQAVKSASGSDRFFTTTDGGQTWTQEMNIKDVFDSFSQIAEFSFIDDQTGYFLHLQASYSAGDTILMKTNDGGANWSAVVSTFPSGFSDLYEIEFVDPQTGFGTMDAMNDGIYKTTDGGQSWNLSLEEPSYDLSFLDAQNGFALTSTTSSIGRNLMKTSNGGSSWDTLPLPSTVLGENVCDYNHLKVQSTSNMLLSLRDCASRYYILRTTDGGNTWDVDSLPDPIDPGQTASWRLAYPSTGIAFATDKAEFLIGEGSSGPSSIEGSNPGDLSASLYPNPSNGTFSVELQNFGTDTRLEIFDVNGRKVHYSSFDRSRVKKKISLDLDKGIYWVHIRGSQGYRIKKMIVQ